MKRTNKSSPRGMKNIATAELQRASGGATITDPAIEYIKYYYRMHGVVFVEDLPSGEQTQEC